MDFSTFLNSAWTWKNFTSVFPNESKPDVPAHWHKHAVSQSLPCMMADQVCTYQNFNLSLKGIIYIIHTFSWQPLSRFRNTITVII
jgi:hypothetical protein